METLLDNPQQAQRPWQKCQSRRRFLGAAQQNVIFFIEFPKKAWIFSYYPDYYDEISSPMSLFMINKKLKGGKYTDLESVLKDFLQVWELSIAIWKLQGNNKKRHQK